MYLVPIHVPIYVRGPERLLATDWKRSLLLLRDSFDGRYGRLHVVSPSIDASASGADQLLEPVRPSDELDLFPSFPFHTRARAFWSKHVFTWWRDVAAQLTGADVVHAGFDDVYRPMNFIAFLLAHQANRPTVFVQDTDHVVQHRELARGGTPFSQLEAQVYCEAFERSVRFGVSRASLSLLKGRALIHRYGNYAKNAKNFHDTSFMSHEVIVKPQLAARLHTLVHERRPLRLVYCGRLEARKGVAESIDAIAAARARGAQLMFDIIGEGAAHAALQRQVDQLGLAEHVRFLGMRPYGQALLLELASYDALLFTPTAEDTPRMIFDGYAAGLPLVGYAIPYLVEREREDRAAVSCERDPHAAATLLVALDHDRPRLAELSLRARDAAVYHAADAWYRRRAEWTAEAVARHQASDGVLAL